MLVADVNDEYTGWPRSYHKYILQITQPSQYRYAKSQYRFADLDHPGKSPFFTGVLLFGIKIDPNFESFPKLTENFTWRRKTNMKFYDNEGLKLLREKQKRDWNIRTGIRTSIYYPWYLYQLPAENTLRTYEGTRYFLL